MVYFLGMCLCCNSTCKCDKVIYLYLYITLLCKMQILEMLYICFFNSRTNKL